jgi:hypothetical protein
VTANPRAADLPTGSVLDDDGIVRCGDCGQPMEDHCPDCCDEARLSGNGTEEA